MADIPRLYNTCLRKVSLFLKGGNWNSSAENPFCNLPEKFVDDLTSTILRIQKLDGFKADDLKLLLTSGTLREFKIEPDVFPYGKFWSYDWDSEQKNIGYGDMEREIVQALKFLASASQNLEVLQLIYPGKNKDLLAFSNDLQNILENSPNLKQIHCKVKFKLKALRNCKKLHSIKLHFVPREPWYDFLEEGQGNKESFKALDSLAVFTICCPFSIKLPESVVTKYIGMILKCCPSLTSFGRLETSRALSKLKQEGILLHLKLSFCSWGDGKCFQDAVEYHPFVEDLCFRTDSIESIAHLNRLRNLVTLRIHIGDYNSDFNIVLDNVLKDIGVQLKHLRIFYGYPTDISIILNKCPNLEALQICQTRYAKFEESAVRLPYLKNLILNNHVPHDESRILTLFSGSHYLTELFMYRNCDDKDIEKFVRRNSLSNLKVASFEKCQLTKRGFKEILLNAPNLEKINTASFLDDEHINQSNLNRAVIDTNHKADITNFCVTDSEHFFLKNYNCKYLP